MPNIQDYFGVFNFLAYLALEKPIEFFYMCKKNFLDENVYIKNSNFGPKLETENSEKSDLEAQKVVRLGFENLQTIVFGP